jgi:hypothetical protein
MHCTAYIIFLDGEKHSIWNDEKDALHQVATLEGFYKSECVTIEELPGVFCTNGVFFL